MKGAGFGALESPRGLHQFVEDDSCPLHDQRPLLFGDDRRIGNSAGASFGDMSAPFANMLSGGSDVVENGDQVVDGAKNSIVARIPYGICVGRRAR